MPIENRRSNTRAVPNPKCRWLNVTALLGGMRSGWKPAGSYLAAPSSALGSLLRGSSTALIPKPMRSFRWGWGEVFEGYDHGFWRGGLGTADFEAEAERHG